MRALLVLVAAGGVAHAEPALRATVTHDLTEVDARGVTRTTHYQERFERAGDHVWLERMVGAAPAVRARPASAHDVDLELAARWWTRGSDGGVRVTLIDAPGGIAIDLTGAEARDHGIADRWLLARALVDRRELTAGAPVPAREARWYTRSNAREVVRVLWSERLAIPLVVEVRSRDGRRSSRAVVEPAAIAAAVERPWQHAAGLRHIELADLED